MKSYLAFIKNFNNYKNRKVVLPDITSMEEITSAGYQWSYCVGPTQTTAIVDFNPNDGVTTSVIVNWSENYTPDYLFVLKSEDSTIDSRWFVMEWKRTRGKQYQVALKRDVIAENFEQIKTSEVFVQKGIVDSDNPLIFNRENMSYNQIKQNETLLKDNTKNAWIVGYFKLTESEKEVKADPQNVQQFIDISNIIQLNNESDPSQGATIKLLDGSINVRTRAKIYGPGNNKIDFTTLFDTNFNNSTNVKTTTPSFGTTSYALIYVDSTPNKKYLAACNSYRNNLKTAFETYNNTAGQSLISSENYKLLQKLEGEIVRVGNSHFKLSLSKTQTIKQEINIYNSGNTASLNAIMDAIRSKWIESLQNAWDESNGNPYYIWWKATTYYVNLQPVSLPGTLSLTLSSNRRKLEDAPYDMFCMPYDSYTLRLAQALVREYTNEQIYDVQVLPYMPQNNCLTSNGTIDLSLGDEGKDYSNVTGTIEYTKSIYSIDWSLFGPGDIGEIVWSMTISVPSDKVLHSLNVITCEIVEGSDFVKAIQFSSDTTKKTITIKAYTEDTVSKDDMSHVEMYIVYNYSIENDTYCQIFYCTNSNRSFVLNGIDVDLNEPKIDNECKFARLVSPNWNGTYEFSPVKNGGINGFNVDITYKPYTPYIHIAPIFGNIYGTVQDARGLICNGDFSITMMNSAWQTYELNNKNYQQIFNAQISTMDKNNQLSVVSNAISSQVNALATGVGTGLMTGNVYAGIAAGALSSAAGIADIGIQQQQYRNNKQLQIDQFGYQLGNVQARPDTLTKVSTLTANNRIWPFIEFYDATDEERTALKNKIKYNGMTIMAIGKMEDYLNRDYEGFNYFQAQLIINTDIACDTHLLDEIDIELQRGIYL